MRPFAPTSVRRSRSLVAIAAVVVAACAEPASGPRVYVTSGFTDEVLILEAGSGEVIDRRAVDPRPGDRDEPHGIAVAPDGRHWYVTLSHGQPTLWKYETEGDRLVGRVDLPLRGAGRVDVSPDGSRAVVTDYWLGGLGAPSEIALVALERLEVLRTLEVCPAPHHAAWSPSGDRIAVTCTLSDEMVILDGTDLEPHARFFVVPGEAGDVRAHRGNPLAQPMNVVWSPDGSRVYVSLMRAGMVVAFDLEGTSLWSIPTGSSPAQIGLTPEGDRLVVANRGDASLTIVDTDAVTGRSLSLPDAAHPHGVALSEDGTVAYVTYEGATTSGGGVLAVDIPGERVVWHTEAGAFTLGVAALTPPHRPDAPDRGSGTPN